MCPSPPDPGSPTPSLRSQIQGRYSVTSTTHQLSPSRLFLVGTYYTLPYLTGCSRYLFRPQRDRQTRPGQASPALFFSGSRPPPALSAPASAPQLALSSSVVARQRETSDAHQASLSVSPAPIIAQKQSSNLRRHLPRRCQRHLTCDIWSVTTGHTRHFYFQFLKASERIEYLSIQITTPHPSFLPLLLSPYRRLFRTK